MDASFTAPAGKRLTIKRNGTQVAVIEDGESVELALEPAFLNSFEILAEELGPVDRKE